MHSKCIENEAIALVCVCMLDKNFLKVPAWKVHLFERLLWKFVLSRNFTSSALDYNKTSNLAICKAQIIQCKSWQKVIQRCSFRIMMSNLSVKHWNLSWLVVQFWGTAELFSIVRDFKSKNGWYFPCDSGLKRFGGCSEATEAVHCWRRSIIDNRCSCMSR